MTATERQALADCIDWDIARIDEIRAAGALSDQQSAQLEGVREHLEQYRAYLLTKSCRRCG